MLAVSDTLPKDRPWNEPIIAMMFCRPVAYRASLIAPSTASVRDPVELLADVGVDREVEVARRIVQELFGLSLDRGDHGGMGVAGRCDGDPRVHIEEQVAVDVLDH